MSAASKAMMDKAAKLASAVQVSIPFGTVSKYKPGLKLLLSESIYGNANDVSTVYF